MSEKFNPKVSGEKSEAQKQDCKVRYLEGAWNKDEKRWGRAFVTPKGVFFDGSDAFKAIHDSVHEWSSKSAGRNSEEFGTVSMEQDGFIAPDSPVGKYFMGPEITDDPNDEFLSIKGPEPTVPW